MKNLNIRTALILCIGLVAALSCKEELKVNQLDTASSLPPPGADSVNYTAPAAFLYNQLRLHLADLDPYTLLPEAQRAACKSLMDSMKAAPQKSVIAVWDKALTNKRISASLHGALKQFSQDRAEFMAKGADQASLDSWYQQRIAQTYANQSLTPHDREFLLKHQAVLRYAAKAFYEARLQPVATDSKARTSSNCTESQTSCYNEFIELFAGIGALFSEGAGGIVGAVVGTVVAIATCSCDSHPCTYSTYISTPDVCYDQYHGLDFTIAGYGNGAIGFQWEVYSSDNMIPANLLVSRSGTTTFNISNAELQGNTAIYVRALTNCGGTLLTPPKLLMINIPYLGQPSFYMTGNTSPYCTAWEGYNLVGTNIQNTVWHIYTYGPSSGTFINQYSTSAIVQWNSTPGYIHLVADASTSCGSYNNGLYITTHTY
ncbi:hypothetical protein [Spirosoma endbachense]|uniref:Uncharacterized protein n=1 Tax=Spirosoma endbachense TaxID=2666025 RepID=A0A6P1W1M6_9BACT|nr:hypothetical protein [Spirosoma endbachense]QHV97889.1 hypothetical protein GJR95_24055 [Spirosoma endbachense]